MSYKKLLLSCTIYCAAPMKSLFFGALPLAIGSSNFTPVGNSTLVNESSIIITHTYRTNAISTTLVTEPTSKWPHGCSLIQTCRDAAKALNSSIKDCTNPDSLVVNPSLIGGLFNLATKEAELAYLLSQFCAIRSNPIDFTLQDVNITHTVKQQCSGNIDQLLHMHMKRELLFCLNTALAPNERHLASTSVLITKMMEIAKKISAMPLPQHLELIKTLIPNIKTLVSLSIILSIRYLEVSEWVDGILAVIEILIVLLPLVAGR